MVPVDVEMMVPVDAGMMVPVDAGMMEPVGTPLPCRGGAGVGSVLSQSAYSRASLTPSAALKVLSNLRFFKPLESSCLASGIAES